MAVRDLTASEQAQIKAYGDAWGKAYAAGDQAGMAAAHAGAEAVRAQAGYSGGADGSQKIALSGSSSGSKSGGTSSGSVTNYPYTGGTPTATTLPYTGGTATPTQYSGGASWQPADTSGNNYGQMVGMSATHLAALEAAGKSWQDAYARGDQNGMDAAHAQAEAIRNLYNYFGGVDGSQYLPFEQQQSTGGSFTYGNAPSYTDKYSAQIEALLNDILNRDAFSYDAMNDPLYQQYMAQYQREGKRAMQDTLGAASARTGGLASSWATTAAQQASDYYSSQMADKIPELYQLAYSMYLDNIDKQVQDVGLLQNMSNTQYDRYRDTMSDWRDDRNFAYDVYRDDIADNKWGTEFGYGAIRDQVSDNRYDKSEAQERINAYLTAGGNIADLDSNLITASGYTQSELNTLGAYYAGLLGEEETAADGGGSSGWNNGKYKETDIAGLQKWLGMPETEQDGRYGAKSAAAAKAKGYTSLDEAMAAYQSEYNGRTYQKIYNQIKTGSFNVSTVAGMIERADLTDAQKGTLLTMIGY